MENDLEKVFANCDELWYVRAREWANEGMGYLPDALAREYDMSEVKQYDGVTLFYCTRHRP